MFARPNLMESVVLAFIIMVLVAPAFFIDIIAPRWQLIDAETFHKSGFIPHLQLTVSRQNIPNRQSTGGMIQQVSVFKSHTITGSRAKRPGMMWAILGISGQYAQSSDHVLDVTKVRFNSPAARAGMRKGDKITSIEIFQQNQQPKELLLILALLFLLIIGWRNHKRALKEK